MGDIREGRSRKDIWKIKGQSLGTYIANIRNCRWFYNVSNVLPDDM